MITAAAAIPLRQRSGDPVFADLLHQARAENEAHIELVQNIIAACPIGDPARIFWETRHTTLQLFAQRLWAVAPPRTRIADGVA